MREAVIDHIATALATIIYMLLFAGVGWVFDMGYPTKWELLCLAFISVIIVTKKTK